jgi:Glycosyl transferase family 2
VKVVMTLLVRDEVDIVRSHLAYHLNAGVDFIVVTDNGSVDGTSEILADYERAGVARVLQEPVGEFRQREWQSRMARLAATDHGADWIVNSDVDEFWWPRGGSFPEVLGEIPGRYGVVQSLVRHFPPTLSDEGPFHERLIHRLAAQAPINDPLSPWRPFRKVVHRAHPDATVIEGGHEVRGVDLQPLRGWYPIECLHFPMRSRTQLESKARSWRSDEEKYGGPKVARAAGAAYHDLLGRAADGDETDEYYASLALTSADTTRGLAEGTLEADVRVRDALRVLESVGGKPEHPTSPLTFPRPTTLETVSFALDAAVLGEADVIRTQRWLDDLERRVGRIESAAPVRVERRLRALARRVRRG